MRKYIIMGPQGSGKGTQAKLLAQAFDLSHISMGEIFRWHLANQTKLAARIQHCMTSGRLVPDDTVEEVVRTRLDLHDWNHGFVLDGFPRTAPQARFFLESYDVDAVILLVVREEVVKKRILGRRLCEKCGEDFNIHFSPPKAEGVCDTCGGLLVAREDDTAEAIDLRLSEYRAKTEPIIEMFRNKERVIDILAEGDSYSVHQEIIQELEREV